MFFDTNNNKVEKEEEEFIDVENDNDDDDDDYSSLLPPKKRVSRGDVSSFHRPWMSHSTTSTSSPTSSVASLTPTKPSNLVGLKPDYSELLLSQLSPTTAMAAATLISFPMFFPPANNVTNEHRVEASVMMTPSSIMSTSPGSPVLSEADSGYHEPTLAIGLVHSDQPLDLSFRRPSTPPPASSLCLPVVHQSYGHPLPPAELLRKQPKHEEERKYIAGIKRREYIFWFISCSMTPKTLTLTSKLVIIFSRTFLCPSKHTYKHTALPSMSSTSLTSSRTIDPVDSSKLICQTCSKQYASMSRFRAHCRRHYAKKMQRYQCDQCHKCFVQRSSLRTHERIHTGERPYHCNVCDERFGDFSTFTKHRRYCFQKHSKRSNLF